MSIQGQAVRTIAAQARETQGSTGGANTASSQGYSRRAATILANNSDGTYRVDVFGPGGTTIMADVLAFARPKSATTLAVGTEVFVELAGGEAYPIIDATALNIVASGGSSIGGIVMVGGSGYISST